MGTLGNVLWFIFCGLWSGLMWIFAGCLCCITVIGIPLGLQCFKFAGLAFFPFGKEVVYGGGAASLIVNTYGNRSCYSRCDSLCNHNRFSFWASVLQIGKTVINAFWSKSDLMKTFLNYMVDD